MKAIHIALSAAALLALAACGDQSPVIARANAAAPLQAAAPGQGVDGSYIVVLKEGADPRSVAAVAGVSPRHVYTAVLNGFAGTLNQGQLTALRHNPDVDYVEQEQTGGIQLTQLNATWGIDRIDQRNLALSTTYSYTATGTGVRVYVIDSGLQANHPQFGTRASNVLRLRGRQRGRLQRARHPRGRHHRRHHLRRRQERVPARRAGGGLRRLRRNGGGDRGHGLGAAEPHQARRGQHVAGLPVLRGGQHGGHQHDQRRRLYRRRLRQREPERLQRLPRRAPPEP